MNLENDGLIEKVSRRSLSTLEVFYRTTEKGKAHIRQLCELPFPRQAWVSADGGTLLVPGRDGEVFQFQHSGEIPGWVSQHHNPASWTSPESS